MLKRGRMQHPGTARSGAFPLAVVVIAACCLFLLAPGLARVRAAEAVNSTNHWAYRPLDSVSLPSPARREWARTRIDLFILHELETKHIAPSPPADKRTWLRRVYFDLTGLPPSPEEQRDFLRDHSKDAESRLVDRLLASPRYGERWARHWMDVAHFAETHGHDQDRIRTNAWPYRDYLIASFNADKPYARFVQEQVAGDVLFPDDPQATVALGFLASGPWDESSLRDIREDTLDRQIARYLDRDDMLTTVMQTFASTTVQCARCHNHKFDPIPQTDYYALQAVFAGVDRANRVYDADPVVHRRRQALLSQRRHLNRNDTAWLLSPEVQNEAADWERHAVPRRTTWKTLAPIGYHSSGGATLTLQNDGSLLASGTYPERDTYRISADPGLDRITAVRLETLADKSLPHDGPGRQEQNGNFHLSEFQLLVLPPRATEPREILLGKATADFDQDGWTIAHALDHNDDTAWGIHPQEGKPHQAVFPLKEPLVLAKGDQLVFVLKQLHGRGHLIGRPRLSATGDPSPGEFDLLPSEITQVLSTEASCRTDTQRALLASFVLRQNLDADFASLPPPSFVYAAASDYAPDGGLKPTGEPRVVRVLRRGEITKPLGVAAPGTLSCVANLASQFGLPNAGDEGARRAALARWLADPDNPPVGRSIVNRVWRDHFGHGLVDTPNDFGRMGETPSNPELLDWLAVWFRDEARGSLKQLHRLLVLSSTYRQTSTGTAPKMTGGAPGPWPDSDNRLLWRMNRTRLDAEEVRDAILQTTGGLDLRMGGPSDYQFDLQPGIHVTPKVDYTKFDLDSPAGHRRGVYRFLFRTLPDPFMEALDCPAGDELTPARNASVTVQQALAMWNNAFVVRQAEHLAERLAKEASTPERQIDRAFQLVLGRACARAERREFAEHVRRHGLASACRVLFNSDEFMFLN